MVSENTFIEAAVRMLRAKAGQKSAENIERFVRIFFERNVYQEMNNLSLEDIEKLIFSLWKFFEKRKAGEAKIEIYETKPDEKFHASRIVINLINDNMPFLIDSLTGFLGRIGLHAHILIRPNLMVRRDREGLLKEIQSTAGTGTILESVIHCQISDPVSEQIISVLKTELPNILRDITISNRDWPLMRLKIKDALEEIKPVAGKISADQVAEVKDFIFWIDNDHFTFLGYREYHFSARKKSIKNEDAAYSDLGILSRPSNAQIGLFYQDLSFNPEMTAYLYQPEIVLITKTTDVSNVHRAVPMDSISIKQFDDQGNITGIRQFIGLFTSIAYSSSARDIPLLRRKVSAVIEKSGFTAQWHDGKALAHIMDSLPRDELFQASEEELLHIGKKVLSIQERPQLALFIRRDHFDRFLSCLVYVPRDRFKYELIECMGKILEKELGCPITLGNAQYGDLAFARVHYMANISSCPASANYNLEPIENKLSEASRSWRDGLRSGLNKKFGEWEGAKLWQKYQDAFSKGYQERFDEEAGVIDIGYIERTYKTQQIQLRLYRPEGAPAHVLKIKLYHPGSALSLSDVLLTFENMDLKVEGEFPSTVMAYDQTASIWIHDFETANRGECPIDIEEIKEKFITMFLRVWQKNIENDGFNRLVIRAGLDWRQCMLMRAYAKYLRQLQIPFSQAYMEETLVKNPEITRLIVRIFMQRFHPKNPQRVHKVIEGISKDIQLRLEKVENPDEDRILRRFMNLMTSTLRTNYFHREKDESYPPYTSFKLDCKAIEELPAPQPLYEIFIYSPRFEAVHLRGGKVARGGIRWSDRKEDFRTEILGLLKAQMVKNAIIVPVGSKGGFIVKTPVENMSREDMQAEGVACYKLMIRAMLELTDNLEKGKITCPPNTVIYDQNDPYLVVAADKGTATFSDYANEISRSLNFWLDDAFASGGSAGYDHKEIGITARGAWESVKRHFREMGTDVAANEITVIGVGDMSGDVFGNGMLQSLAIKLVAAFNHRHIFIDPHPHHAVSYAERKRLFEERLGWDGYNPNLISTGGGVFMRHAKIIKTSPEIRHLLSLHTKEVTPNELIQAILTTHVDLVWFGGIGTYIKSRLESHLDVGDRTNDSIRINSNMLRCKVIAEGANLAVTQRARIDFARSGGHINTDAIDNSGGVDCSDHEVNIKILLRQAMMKKKLSLKDRNILLEKMTNEVASLVLKNNYDQNLSLSLISAQGIRTLDPQIKLIHSLEKAGRLDRALEFLPDDTELADYQASRTSLTRPQLAILLPYAKNALYESILCSELPDEALLADEAVNYFPKPLQNEYKGFIKTHPLRRELIATVVANKIVNRMGPSFVHELVEKTGKPIEDVVRTYYVIQKIFKIEDLWQDIENLNIRISPDAQTQAFQKLWELIRRTGAWFLKHFPTPLNVARICSMYMQGIQELFDNFKASLHSDNLKHLKKEIAHYKKLGLKDAFSERMARLEIIASSPDIILIAEKSKAFVPDVANLYFTIGARFKFDFLQKLAEGLKSNNSWQRMAVNALIEDLQSSQSALTIKILKYTLTHFPGQRLRGPNMIQGWASANKHLVRHIEQLFTESNGTAIPDLAFLTVLQRELRMLSG